MDYFSKPNTTVKGNVENIQNLGESDRTKLLQNRLEQKVNFNFQNFYNYQKANRKKVAVFKINVMCFRPYTKVKIRLRIVLVQRVIGNFQMTSGKNGILK